MLLFRDLGRGDERPGANVPRRVVVRICRETAMLADEFGLVLSVGLFAMSAFATSAAGVAGVHLPDGDSIEQRLVLDELAEPCKRPTRHLGSLLTLEPSPFADVRQVFERDSATGAFGVSDELLADTVVYAVSKSLFSMRESLESPANGTGTKTSLLPCGGCFLESLTPREISLADFLDFSPTITLFVAGRGNPRHTEIDADEVFRLDRSLLGEFSGSENVEFLVPIDNINLSFASVEALFLVFTEDNRDMLSPVHGQDTDGGYAPKREQPLVVGHGSVRFENRALGLVPCEAFDRLANCANGHLGRQPELFANLVVATLMDADLADNFIFEADFRRIGRGGVELAESTKKPFDLFGGRKHLDLNR